MSESTKPDRPKLSACVANYRWIPWAFIAAFIVVFAVNGGLIYYAASTWPGLTTDHAYNEGLAYNRVIDQAAKEAQLGWKMDLAFSPRSGAVGGTLVIIARDASGAALGNLALRGELVRPVEEIANVPLTFVAQGDGRYVATVEPPRPGQWNVFLSAERGSELWHGGQRILVPAS